MDAEELQSRIDAFPRWNYRFEFDNGVSTPMADPEVINRHRQRRRYFFEALLGLTGGSLRGRRVLDLGCNSGYWSLESLQAGADFVLGLDAVQSYVEQAELVLEAKGVDPKRYRLEQGNVFVQPTIEHYDVVLCLGLMDRVAKPVELFELMSRVGPEIIVIDTEVSRARLSLFEMDSLYDSSNAVDYELALIPSRQALIDLAAQFDFETVVLPHNIADYSGMSDYLRQRRLAFICSKSVALGGLPREKRSALPWWLTALNARRHSR